MTDYSPGDRIAVVCENPKVNGKSGTIIGHHRHIDFDIILDGAMPFNKETFSYSDIGYYICTTEQLRLL